MLSLFVVLLNVCRADPTPATPAATELPTGLYWGIVFGCTGVAGVLMFIIGAIAVYFMKKQTKPEYENVAMEQE